MTYPQSPWGECLFAGNGMNDGKISFHAYHDQDEYWGRRAQAMDELVHFAQEIAKDPTASNLQISKKINIKSNSLTFFLLLFFKSSGYLFTFFVSLIGI